MADRKPLKVLPDGGGDSTGLGEFVAADTVGIADGGTGSTFGLLSVNSSGAALASQNAHKIILVDLTDPSTMWDIETFLARVRHTSWYEELGAPPMRGAIWITEAQTSMVWWNLDTDSQYIKFDLDGSSNTDSNMLYFSSSNPPDSLAFLDGKIFYAVANSGGAWIIDFLRDESIGWFASGQRRYSGNIKERNDGNGNIATKSTALRSNNVHGIVAVRDPLTVDEFDRPKHWWAIATDDGTGGYAGDVYNPINDAIYYSSMGDDLDAIAMSQSGKMWWMRDSSPDSVYGYDIYTVSASAVAAPNYLQQAVWNGGSIGNSGSAVIADLAAFDAPNGFDGLAVATNAGLDLGFITSKTTTNQNTESAHIFITSTYQTPYMKGTRVAAYPLNDANDRSGKGHNLTNNNTVTFASGGPTGSYANFVAASSQSLTLADDADFGGMSELTLSCWFKRDIDSGAAMILMGKYDTASSGDRSFLLQIDSADKINFQCVTGSGSVGASAANPPTEIDTWYHVAAIYDGANLKVYLDGVVIGSASQTGTVVDTTEPFCIGSHTSGSPNANWFDGQIAGVFVGSTAMTEAEVKLEHQRGVRVLGGATAKLANSDVKSVRVDQNSGLAAITTAANQTEIWDVTTGLRESIDGTTTATINDADLALKSGADDPEYITGRSGAIEFDGKARRVIG